MPETGFIVVTVPRAGAVVLQGIAHVVAEAIGRQGIAVIRPDYPCHNGMDNSLQMNNHTDNLAFVFFFPA